MARIRQMLQQKDGKQLPQGTGTHSDKKVKDSGNPKHK